MLNSIIAFSVRNKLIIGLFTIALVAYGSYEITRLPIDAVPDITENQVQIITVAPSFGATDIERLVTFPIEQAVSNIDGTKAIRSFSRFGLSLVTLVFTDATDLYLARQQVAERLLKVQNIIPKEYGTPELGPITTGLGEIFQYVVKPKPGYEKKYSLIDLRTIQDWVIRRQLLGVQGVAEVSSFGGKTKQYEIAVNYNKLQSYQVTISDLFKALEQNNQNTGGAYIEKGPTLLFIRTEGLIGSIDDIGLIPVKQLDNGIPLLIRDIADVHIGYATRYGAMTYNNTGEVAGAVVMMLKGANSSKVIQHVKDRVDEIRKTLPEGVEIEPFLDRTKMVNHAISTVTQNLMEGALIVVFILVLFLGNVRAGLLVASIIPLSMLFAVIMMNLFGVSGNLMSLGALDFGLIVDGAVIIVEATLHQLTHNKRLNAQGLISQEVMDHQVHQSASRMMNSAVFGQIIILIVYLPVFTLQGIEGKMFKPMAQTVAFALTGAFILSLTYIPMMSTLMLSRKRNLKKNVSEVYFDRLNTAYHRALQKVLPYPRLVIGIAFALFAGSVLVLSQMGGEFIPSLEEGDLAVDTRVLTGSNLNTTINHVSKASGMLKTNFPEVEKVVTKIGSGDVPTDPMPIEASDMMVILKDKNEWTSAHTYQDLIEKMSLVLKDIPGVTYGFQYPVQMRFNELMTGARQDVVCKIFGENLDTLTTYANRLGKLIGTVEGANDLYVESVLGMPQVIIRLNRAAIAQYHVSIADVNQTVNAAFAGQTAGTVMEDEKRFACVVRLESGQRSTIQDIRHLLVPTRSGEQIPLSLLADIQQVNGPNQIQREDAKRRIVIGFNVRNRDVQSIVNELKNKADQELHLPAGYAIRYGGAFENLEAAKSRLLFAVPVSLLLILLMLYFAFSSLRQGLLIYSAIPLSAIGGILLLALRGMPFSISAGVGFIALFGVSVLNGIVLISEFRQLASNGMTDLREIVIQGTRNRLRPVLMTAAVAALGFLPMAISNGAGAEVQRPLATVVIGGLLFATLLTLFVLPVLYLMFAHKPMHSKGTLPIIIAFAMIIASHSTSAQHSISLAAAIDSAVHNNLDLRNELLQVSYKQKLSGTSWSIPKTLVTGELGKINSYYNDNRISVSQSFEFPSVYIHQHHMLRQEVRTAQAGERLKRAELVRDVSQWYALMIYLKRKSQLLAESDSMYRNFLDLARIRQHSGETDLLEVTAAENQLGQLRLQQRQVQLDLQSASWKLAQLLNVSVPCWPSDTVFQPGQTKTDSSMLSTHPSMRVLEYRLGASKAQANMMQSRLLPDLFVGYNNMSMIGNGADGVTYTGSTRFQSFQAGLAIPLFFGSAKARSSASAVEVQIEKNRYEQQLKSLRIAYQQVLRELSNATESLTYFETTGLQSANTIVQTAGHKFRQGEINYLQWVQLINQAVQVRSNYLDNQQQYYDALIRLAYLTQSEQ